MVSHNPLDLGVVQAMRDTLRHRGPDAEGSYVNEDATIALGHTRLSIIDLHETANQPFISGNGRYVIVFNGEIYNFKLIKQELHEKYGLTFRTNSDTEVLAESFSIWGVDMLPKLSGMFAIAILDKDTNKVYLFRDRVGKKPIFYFKSERLFAFASEIKALLQHPEMRRQVKVDLTTVTSFLHLGYIPEPKTIYSNIYKFPAGHYGEVDSNLNFHTKPYWRLQDQVHQTKLSSPKEAKDKLKLLLDQSVQSRLLSDVPLGSFLSGGTDSSLISAIASKHVSGSLRTFSIGFHESKFDESKYAVSVARHLNTLHTEYKLGHREAIDLMESYLEHFDEPFADTSAIPTMLVSKLARKEVTVALTGDGGDELFQGYGSYVWANRLESARWNFFKRPLRIVLKGTNQSRFHRIADLLEPVKDEGLRSHIFSQEQYFFSQNEIQNQLLKDRSDFVEFNYTDAPEFSEELSPGEKQSLFDLQYYLKDDLLVKVDRASMLYSLECRCPFLDHSIIEFALSIDEHLKIKNGTGKWMLKELLKDYLPTELVNRPKWGFSVPLANWLKGELSYLMENFLNVNITREIGLFKSEYVEQLKTNFKLNNKEYLYHRLWSIIVLHKWIKEHGA